MRQLIKNRKATYEYTILEKLVAGIQLAGSEVKSIKASKVSVVEAYCFIQDGEIFIKGMHVSEHKEGGKHFNHTPVRDRKLLLHKREITKLFEKVGQKGLSIVPLAIFVSDTGLIKVEIGLAKGKKNYDKKESIKEKDIKRDLARNL